MRAQAPYHVEIVRTPDKEERLRKFMLAAIAALIERRQASRADCLVIARSGDSPVISALLSVLEDGFGTKLTVRVVFAPLAARGVYRSVAALAGHSHILGCRISSEPRIAEAHEQLVLGRTAVWTGDAMRRDPLARDSYEVFAPSSAKAASLARVTFFRFWNAAPPCEPERTIAGCAAGLPEAAELLTAKNGTPAPHPVTRH